VPLGPDVFGFVLIIFVLLSLMSYTARARAHSGEGEDFLMGQLIFFTKTALTPERKVEKSIPRWEINRHAEG